MRLLGRMLRLLCRILVVPVVVPSRSVVDNLTCLFESRLQHAITGVVLLMWVCLWSVGYGRAARMFLVR